MKALNELEPSTKMRPFPKVVLLNHIFNQTENIIEVLSRSKHNISPRSQVADLQEPPGPVH